MKREKSGARAKTSAPEEKFALISDATLLALHRRLLKAVAQVGRDGARAEKGIGRYAAARVAVWLDLKRPDTIVEAAAAAQMKDALGAALRNKAGKNRRIVIAWGGEAGADWQAAMEQARAASLPVVFVGEASDGRRLRAGMSRTKRKLKPGEELPSITVDGHDVVAAYRVAHEAIERARRDRGPTLILLATYKIGGREFTDAVADMERYLRGRGLLRAGNKGARRAEANSLRGMTERKAKTKAITDPSLRSG